ncbi:unnamed protein product [Mortierella alpina]
MSRCPGSIAEPQIIARQLLHQQQPSDQADPPLWIVSSSLLSKTSPLGPTPTPVHALASHESHPSDAIDTGMSGNHHHKFSAGAIAGITLGSLLVLVLLGLGLYYWRTRRFTRRIHTVDPDQDVVTEMRSSTSNSNSGPFSSAYPPPLSRALFPGKAAAGTSAPNQNNNSHNNRAWTAQPMVTISISSDDPNHDPAESGVKGQAFASSSSSSLSLSSPSSLARDHRLVNTSSHSLDPYTGRLVTSYNPTSAESYRTDMGLQPGPSPNRSAVHHSPYGSSGRITPEGAR